EIFYAERLFVIVLPNSPVLQAHFIFQRIKRPIGQNSIDVAERHHHQVSIIAVTNPCRYRARPIGLRPRRAGLSQRSLTNQECYQKERNKKSHFVLLRVRGYTEPTDEPSANAKFNRQQRF